MRLNLLGIGLLLSMLQVEIHRALKGGAHCCVMHLVIGCIVNIFK
jgi:hypothetical protein